MTASMDRTEKRAYTTAGEQLKGFSQIAVASQVDLPGDQEMDGRVRYRADADEVPDRRGIPILWAGFLLVLAVAIMFGMSMKTSARANAYNAEMDQLRQRFYAIADERSQLEANIALACDPAKICYHAARELGMQLAVESQTIQVVAPATRIGTPPGYTTASNGTGGMR